MVSIHMLKLCGKSIYKPLDLTFQFFIQQGEFNTAWKKTNVALVHKKVTSRFLKSIYLYLHNPSLERSLNV